MELTPLMFDPLFSRFDKQVRSKSGEAFTSFKVGLPARWEGYKEDLHKEALYRLDVRSWKRSEVGKGHILSRVIDAIQINVPSRNIVNNLVDWPNRYGHKHRSHRALLDARRNPKRRVEFEKWFFTFFKTSKSEEKAFEEFPELTRNRRYDLVAYLFFLKDWDRFMPIAPATFDKAFRLLGSDLVTSGQCSWANYARYNENLKEVQRALRDYQGIRDARLIDAHSFCWILIRLKLPPATQKPVIPMPMSVEGLRNAVITEFEIQVNGELTKVNEKDFLERHLRNIRLGKLAQDIALCSERKRLAQAGVNAKVVKPVWDQPSRGFDIVSCEPNGKERLIEVKAARRLGGRLTFCLTDYEWRVSQKRRNYYFYLVLNPSTVRPKVLMINASRIRQQYLKPTDYVASFGAAF
jgi:hypothetical protein